MDRIEHVEWIELNGYHVTCPFDIFSLKNVIKTRRRPVPPLHDAAASFSVVTSAVVLYVLAAEQRHLV